ncbi:MAG: DUF6311 domain-containing protein [Sulfurimonas sp.]|jgi:hypothetical protein
MSLNLTKNMSTRSYYFLSLAIATFYLFYIFSLDFFTGSNAFWFDVRTDPTQHITGMWAYVGDSWHFPLLDTTYLNYPQGSNAAFTDSIPIAALLYKLLGWFLPHDWHYFGWWVFFSYLLQAVAGAYFLGEATTKTPYIALVGVLFAVTMPSLMIRIPHTALLTQGLLIFMLAFYYLTMQGKQEANTALKKELFILYFSCFVHPYLTSMLFVIFFVSLISFWIYKKTTLGKTLLYLASGLVGVFFFWYIIGYINFEHSQMQTSGFEINSMNLLSPLLGTNLAESFFLPSHKFVLDATGLQVDGHNYLGFGTLLLLGYLLLFHFKIVMEGVLKHWILAVAALLLTLYSLSTKIYAADTLLFTYELPKFFELITGTFRSSGRFFWTVGYVLVFFSLVTFLTQKNIQKALYGVLFLTIIQVIDTTHHRSYLKEALSREKYFKVDYATWNELVAQSTKVYLFPPYKCGAEIEETLMLQYFASLHRKPFNSGFLARANVDCEQKNTVLEKEAEKDVLYIFLKDKIEEKKIKNLFKDSYEKSCKNYDIGIVCKKISRK